MNFDWSRKNSAPNYIWGLICVWVCACVCECVDVWLFAYKYGVSSLICFIILLYCILYTELFSIFKSLKLQFLKMASNNVTSSPKGFVTPAPMGQRENIKVKKDEIIFKALSAIRAVDRGHLQQAFDHFEEAMTKTINLMDCDTQKRLFVSKILWDICHRASF